MLNYRNVDEFIARSKVKKDLAYAPSYHFTPPTGWMNDPNGLCQFKGTYHLFYQYNPFKTKFGIICWGHATSDDLIHWKDEKVAIKPQFPKEIIGVWSGSALVCNGEMHLFYTSNSLIQQQSGATYDEEKGVAIKWKENPIIKRKHLLVPGEKKDFRDPKIMPVEDGFWMVVGGKQGGTGVMYYYKSSNLKDWVYCGYVPYPEFAGALECPDIFELDGKIVCCASRPGNVKYYVYEDIPIHGGKLLYTGKLDYGDYFYAPQTFRAEDGRRILISWANKWNVPCGTASHGWAGTMTVPRELRLTKNNELVIKPVKEVDDFLANHSTNKSKKTTICLDFSESVCYQLTLLKDKITEKGIVLIVSRNGDTVEIYKKTEHELKVLASFSTMQREIYCDIYVDSYIAELYFDKHRIAITEVNYYENEIEPLDIQRQICNGEQL